MVLVWFYENWLKFHSISISPSPALLCFILLVTAIPPLLDGWAAKQGGLRLSRFSWFPFPPDSSSLEAEVFSFGPPCFRFDWFTWVRWLTFGLLLRLKLVAISLWVYICLHSVYHCFGFIHLLGFEPCFPSHTVAFDFASSLSMFCSNSAQLVLVLVNSECAQLVS